jgi:hypothetical protein
MRQDRWLRQQVADMAKITRIVAQVGELEEPTSATGATAAGDAARLRGIPAVGRGCAGAIRGSNPVAELMRRATGEETLAKHKSKHGIAITEGGKITCDKFCKISGTPADKSLFNKITAGRVSLSSLQKMAGWITEVQNPFSLKRPGRKNLLPQVPRLLHYTSDN